MHDIIHIVCQLKFCDLTVLFISLHLLLATNVSERVFSLQTVFHLLRRT